MGMPAMVETVPLGTGADGVIRVAGTRVTLETVVEAFRDGATAEEIVQQYPSLFLADVYQILGYYLRGLSRRRPDVDMVRIQDVGLSGASDEVVLAWAAAQRRVLFTHDVSTITKFAYERVRAGLAMPGVFEVPGRCRSGARLRTFFSLRSTAWRTNGRGRYGFCRLTEHGGDTMGRRSGP